MSIATEITRIQGAKSALKASIEAKGVEVPASAKIDAYAALVDEIQAGGASLTEAYRAAQGYLDLTDWSAYISELASVAYGMIYYFNQPSQFANRATGNVIINAETIAEYAYRNAFLNTRITSIDVTQVERIEAAGMAYICQNVPSLVGIVDYENLTYIGYGGFEGAFQSTGITEIRFPKLASFGGYPYGAGSAGAPFRNCTNLKTAHLHPYAVRAGFAASILWGCPSVENVTLSEMATDSITFAEQVNLTSASVLDILRHLSTGVTGKTCTFGNITIPSSDPLHGAIAIAASTASNWTISGLSF